VTPENKYSHEDWSTYVLVSNLQVVVDPVSRFCGSFVPRGVNGGTRNSFPEPILISVGYNGKKVVF